MRAGNLAPWQAVPLIPAALIARSISMHLASAVHGSSWAAVRRPGLDYGLGSGTRTVRPSEPHSRSPGDTDDPPAVTPCSMSKSGASLRHSV